MDVVSLLFLFLMVVLGGASAFLADWLAWRIGKRRHSLFGMRPKHFARLTVTLTGMMIPFVTILLVAALSRDVREWITKGNAAIRELPAAQEELNRTKSAVATLEKQRGELRSQNEQSRQAIQRQSAELLRRRDEAARLGTLISSQQSRLTVQAGRLAAQASRIAELTPRVRLLAEKARLSASQASRLQEQNREVRDSLRRARTQYARENARLGKVQQSLALATSEYKTVSTDFNKTNTKNFELTQLNSGLEKRLAELQGEVNGLQSEIARLERERATVEGQSREAKAQRDALQEQVALLDAEAEHAKQDFRANTLAARREALIYVRDDELARVIVPAGASVEAARKSVLALMSVAAREAARKGAKGESASDPAALLANPPPPNGRPLTTEEVVDLWATRAAGGKVPRVLLARAALNFFANEVTLFRLELQEAPIVYEDGAVVAEARIDGRRPDAIVYAQVTEFLSSRVNAAARAAKMVPRQENGEPTFGQVDTGEILQIVRQARDAGAVVRIQAVVEGQVSAADPLKIRLRLR